MKFIFRPTSAKSVSLSGVVDCIERSDDEVDSIHSGHEVDFEEETRRSRRRRDESHQSSNRSSSLFSQNRQSTGNLRPNPNISFTSSGSKGNEKSNQNEPAQLKKILDRLWSEFENLGSLTGFYSDRKSSGNTCSTALALALITLTGHVKQCAQNCQEKHDLKNFKDQLSIIIKNQLDFQQKIENQMFTLQTMMQTVCQMVNTEIVSRGKAEATTIVRAQPVTIQSTNRYHRETDYQAEPRDHWSKSHTSSTLKPSSTAIEELLTFTQRMNDDASNETNNFHLRTEHVESSKKATRPTSSISNHENQNFDLSKYGSTRRTNEIEPRSALMSPIEAPSNYDLFESGLPSTKETLLEKILQERLRLVQHMAELSKQHDLPQDDLTLFSTRNNDDKSN